MINGADIMVKCLEAEGVSVVFGYPGAAICPFYDSLYNSSIKHVLVRQEQNAAHAARSTDSTLAVTQPVKGGSANSQIGCVGAFLGNIQQQIAAPVHNLTAANVVTVKDVG